MLGWDRLSISRTKQKAVVMFNTLNNQMPPYLQGMFAVRDFYYNIRRSENILHVPKPRTILSEVLGILGLSFRMNCHPNYVSR